jgi:D-alanine-D-alanine ligase
MTLKVAIIYNDPYTDVPNQSGEEEAIVGVLEEVFAVRDALKELQIDWHQVPLRRPLDSVGDVISTIEADIIFNLFEGFDDTPHSEPLVARMMEDMGLRFTGNPSQVLAFTLDKARTKDLLKSKGIFTPDYQVLTPNTVGSFKLKFPCIVKPRDEDASHGLGQENVVHNTEQLEKQVQRISGEFRGYALVEEFIDGREFNSSILGKKDIELVEISEITYTLPPELPRMLTFESKWFEGTPYYLGTGVQCPAEISAELRKTIEDVVLTSCRAVGACGYARVDMRQDSSGRINVLEVNANPDLSPGLGIALQAEKHGISYSQLIKKIIDLAME